MLRRKRPPPPPTSSSAPAVVSAEQSLDELREALDRLEYLIAKISPSPAAAAAAAAAGLLVSLSTPPPGGSSEVAGSSQKVKEEEAESSVNDVSSIRPTILFMQVESADENEIIELLRRIVEIVVLCERRAGQLLAKYAASSSSSSSYNTRSTDDETNKEENEKKEEEILIDYEAAALPYIAPFELFCERTILAKIVMLVTGIEQQTQTQQQQQQQQHQQVDCSSVATTTNKDDEESLTTQIITQQQKQPQQQLLVDTLLLLLLPPTNIATQAIQSISILIQNVSRATSLYFLLSNDIVNELIQLPIESYRIAAAAAAAAAATTTTASNITTIANAAATAIATSKKGGGERLQQQQQQQQQQSSSEISELITHFVSFLKSLALRLNPETVQFFLKEGTCSSSSSGNNGSDSSSRQIQFPLYARALEFCGGNDNNNNTSSLSSTLGGVGQQQQQQHWNDDSFVRLTAMNVCMNILRLVTIHDNDVDNDDDSINSNSNDENVNQTESSAALPTTTPTGMLHDNPPILPKQDRSSIAKFACQPDRLTELISPLCYRLTSRFGMIHVNNDSNNNHQQQQQQQQQQNDRNITNLLADVQDELLLFDDLLNVNLIPMNEYAIEMLLATFVYPMLLQPLLLLQQQPQYLHQQSKMEEEDGVVAKELVDSSSNVEDVSSSSSSSDNNMIIMDLSSTKTALYGIALIFNTITNPTFRYLLLMALLHPLSPSSSSLSVGETNCSGMSFEEQQQQLEIPANIYSFGLCSGSNSSRDSHSSYILAPSLLILHHVYKTTTTTRRGDRVSNIVEKNVNCCCDPEYEEFLSLIDNKSNTPEKRKDDEADDDGKTRLNPYRQIILSLISGSGGLTMSASQSLATSAMQGAILSLDYKIVQGIMFPIGGLEEGMDEVERRKETVSCLCRGIVIPKLMTNDGWSTIQFNTVAARTLMVVMSNNSSNDCIQFARDVIRDILHETVTFLLTFSSRLDDKSREGIETSSTTTDNSSTDKQHLNHWLIDRFFFDEADKSIHSVVEHLCYLKENDGSRSSVGNNDDMSKERYRYGLDILRTITMTETCAILREDTPVVSRTAPFHFATTCALACLYLDALCEKLTKMYTDRSNNASPRVLSFISSTGPSSSSSGSLTLAHISSKLAIAMLDERDSSVQRGGNGNRRNSSHNSNNDSTELPPAHGSSVGLVEKAAFPCVCEVSSASSVLFTGRTCITNEGVRWQSLYLVVVGRWAVLAEPGHSSTGGEGRVITSCRLACLAIKKDTASVNGRTPARRLLMSHASLDPRPPSLFVVDSSLSTSATGASSQSTQPRNGLRLTRSRMDLWFEDETSAAHAYKVISSKIARARGKRGSKIKAALLRI